MHKAKTIQQTTNNDFPTNRSKTNQWYYVDMPQCPTMLEEQLEEINFVNLDENSLGLLHETQHLPDITQESMSAHNLFSLLHLYLQHRQKEGYH